MRNSYEQKSWEFAAESHKRYKKHLKSAVIYNVPSLKNYYEAQIEAIEQKYPSLKGVNYD